MPPGTRRVFNIRIAGKTLRGKLTYNRALKKATTIVLRDKKLKKFDVVIAGITKVKDIKRPKAIDRFKGTKGDKVYTFVQK